MIHRGIGKIGDDAEVLEKYMRGQIWKRRDIAVDEM